VIDGFITANKKKADDSNIISTMKNVLHIRKPLDLGSVVVPWDRSMKTQDTTPVDELETQFDAIVKKMVFTRASIRRGRLQVLAAIDRYMDERANLLVGVKNHYTIDDPRRLTILNGTASKLTGGNSDMNDGAGSLIEGKADSPKLVEEALPVPNTIGVELATLGTPLPGGSADDQVLQIIELDALKYI
jgi:hypothetical protein